MKKQIVIISFQIVLSFFLFSNNNELVEFRFETNINSDVLFKNDQILFRTFSMETDEITCQSFPYIYYTESKIPLINIYQEKKITERWLVLFHTFNNAHEGEMFLYKNNQERPEYLFGRRGGLIFQCDITATSFLTEGKKKYKADNLNNYSLEMPWVEGVDGDGIGEKIFITPNSLLGEINILIFSNGFVSRNRPELYKHNSRVKKIKILSTNSKMVCELDDSPNFQQIVLPNPSRNIEIEILEVYTGSKYEDTCINFILFL